MIFKICLEILWFAQKFLVTQINDDDEVGYDIDQELKILDMHEDLGYKKVHHTRISIDHLLMTFSKRCHAPDLYHT